MKLLLFLILICFAFYSSAHSETDSTSTRIKTLIARNNDGKLTKAEKGELRNYGYSIQNQGFALEERHRNYSEALSVIDSAISFWVATNDSLNEANLRKYRGYLLGNLNRFKEGKQEIERAIDLFKKLERAQGIAVSQHDMSLVLELEGKLDSALTFQKQATLFWHSRGDTKRIVVNDNHLIHLYVRLKDFGKAKEVQVSNEALFRSDLPWIALINFYYVSYELFSATGDQQRSDFYSAAYKNKIELLKKEGIHAKSGYERDQ